MWFQLCIQCSSGPTRPVRRAAAASSAGLSLRVDDEGRPCLGQSRLHVQHLPLLRAARSVVLSPDHRFAACLPPARHGGHAGAIEAPPCSRLHGAHARAAFHHYERARHTAKSHLLCVHLLTQRPSPPHCNHTGSGEEHVRGSEETFGAGHMLRMADKMAKAWDVWRPRQLLTTCLKADTSEGGHE